MEWYKTLDINQRINLKHLCSTLVGADWSSLSLLFSYKEKINILHKKLKLEGFDV